MRTIMVTGGAGFIGSNLCFRLAGEGFSVRVLDDFSTGNRENLKGLEGIELVKGDIRNLGDVKGAMDGAHAVLHQAAMPSVSRSLKDPLHTARCNTIGSLNVLEAVRKLDIGALVYASSSSVYGDSETSPKREDLRPSPLSPYAASKLSAEHFFEAYSRVYGLHSTGLRYFNVYGPRQDPSSEYAAVIPRFIKLMLKGRRPVIYGDGEQTRDFTYVEDAVTANLLAMDYKAKGHEIFNIAAGRAVSVNELVSRLNDIMGKNIKPEYSAPRPGDIRHSCADISKAGERLGFRPEFSIESGLRETIEWFGDKHA